MDKNIRVNADFFISIRRRRRVFLLDKWEFWQKQLFWLGVRKASRVKLGFTMLDQHVVADMPTAPTITRGNY